jgi:hypothetical protein
MTEPGEARKVRIRLSERNLHNSRQLESKEIRDIVELEIEDRESFEWPEHWSDRIMDCIIDPFEGSFFNPEIQDLEDFWVVADLEPGNKTEGYLVVYDADSDLFGLAEKLEVYENGNGLLTGLFGNLLNALESIPSRN